MFLFFKDTADHRKSAGKKSKSVSKDRSGSQAKRSRRRRRISSDDNEEEEAESGRRPKQQLMDAYVCHALDDVAGDVCDSPPASQGAASGLCQSFACLSVSSRYRTFGTIRRFFL